MGVASVHTLGQVSSLITTHTSSSHCSGQASYHSYRLVSSLAPTSATGDINKVSPCSRKCFNSQRINITHKARLLAMKVTQKLPQEKTYLVSLCVQRHLLLQ